MGHDDLGGAHSLEVKTIVVRVGAVDHLLLMRHIRFVTV